MTGLPLPVTAEQRYHYVEVAAYYIAEKRGFDAGSHQRRLGASRAGNRALIGRGKDQSLNPICGRRIHFHAAR